MVSNDGALRIPRVPDHLVVVGAGVIGLELGSVWRRLGARVTVLELAPSILPGFDADMIKEAEKVFRQQGLDLRTAVRVTGARASGERITVEYEKDGGVDERIDADHVLVAVGRRPSLQGIDAAALGLGLGARGEILVDDQMRTNLPHVYAIGDAVGGKLLAHKAEEEGVVAAEVIAGHSSRMHYRTMRDFDDFAGLVRVDVGHVAVGDQQVAVGGERKAERAVQMSLVAEENSTRPLDVVQMARPMDRVDQVVHGRIDEQRVGFGLYARPVGPTKNAAGSGRCP